MTDPKEGAIRNFAEWDLLRNRDYYPAGAMNKDSCFYNGQIGNCGADCTCYQLGNCPIPEEMEERIREMEEKR